jgi:hypothetical protein
MEDRHEAAKTAGAMMVHFTLEPLFSLRPHVPCKAIPSLLPSITAMALSPFYSLPSLLSSLRSMALSLLYRPMSSQPLSVLSTSPCALSSPHSLIQPSVCPRSVSPLCLVFPLYSIYLLHKPLHNPQYYLRPSCPLNLPLTQG